MSKSKKLLHTQKGQPKLETEFEWKFVCSTRRTEMATCKQNASGRKFSLHTLKGSHGLKLELPQAAKVKLMLSLNFF